MLTIATPDLTKINPYAKGYIRELLEGELYEQALCDAINAAYPHLRAYRPRQRFLAPVTAAHYSKRLADHRKTLEYRQRLEIACLDESQKVRLRPQQTDVWVCRGIRTYHLEIKSLTPIAFGCNPIHFGNVAKFDQKIRRDWFHYREYTPDNTDAFRKALAVPFDAVVLINQVSGETWLVPHWTRWELSPDLWDKTTSRKLPDGTLQHSPVLDYAIPSDSLTPLDDWLKTL